MGKNPLPKVAHAFVRIQFFVDCWTERHSSSLTVGQPALQFLLHDPLKNGSLLLKVNKSRRHKGKSTSERDSASKMELTVFCNLIMEVICHHFLFDSLP